MNTGQLSVFQLPCIHLAPKPEACRHFIFLQNTGKHLLRHTLKIIDSPEGLKIIQKNTDANKKEQAMTACPLFIICMQSAKGQQDSSACLQPEQPESPGTPSGLYLQESDVRR